MIRARRPLLWIGLIAVSMAGMALTGCSSERVDPIESSSAEDQPEPAVELEPAGPIDCAPFEPASALATMTVEAIPADPPVLPGDPAFPVPDCAFQVSQPDANPTQYYYYGDGYEPMVTLVFVNVV